MGSSKTLGILVDTNILLYIYYKIDPFWLVINSLEYKPRFLIHEAVFNELKTLEKRYINSASFQSKIRLARMYLEKYKEMWSLIPMKEEQGPTDDILLDVASREGLILFTNDRELKIRAINKGIGIIFLTSKGKIIKSNFPI
ncbi:twitching motility protein PilT [Acidianus sulfidivorans JP7]|uniref:Twitching motility protein PilT n=1 Tax=Acidianus sulfidivorans JP7 TaxID=619593 RepID=A0A2U9IMB1_9CREN|nr:PIN domain-containing protein [Acidianus sulfidivorans]AWR97168.1 twitching motility protein PilT [Acidianus sulfidivorans JP7]